MVLSSLILALLPIGIILVRIITEISMYHSYLSQDKYGSREEYLHDNSIPSNTKSLMSITEKPFVALSLKTKNR